MSWEPLAETDPVPGDPDAVAALAGRLRAVAGVIREQNGRLRAVGADCFWEGEAAGRFEEVQQDLPPMLDLIGDRYEEAAGALERYARPLQAARSEARAALADARDAQGRRDAALDGIEAMATHDRTEAQRATTSQGAGESPLYQAVPWSGTDWDSRLAQADEDLAAARARLERAVTSRDTAGGDAAERVRAAADDSIKDDQSIFGKVKRTVSGAARAVVDALPIEELATVAAVAAAALVVASLLIPGVNLLTAAVILGVAVLTLDSMIWAADDFEADTGVNVALDTVALATLGVGRVFGAVARPAAAGRPAVAASGLAGRSSAAAARFTGGAERATAAAGRWGRVTSVLSGGPLGRAVGATLPGRGLSRFAAWRAGANTARAAELGAQATQAAQRAETFATAGRVFQGASDGVTVLSGALGAPGFVDLVDGAEPSPPELVPVGPVP